MVPIMKAPASALDIVKVLRVTDTRDYIEGPDDKWVPVPGSGEIATCARCGRAHEVHAEVLLRSGGHAIVGTGCAMKDAVDLASGIKSEESRAKTIRRWETRLAFLREELARYGQIMRDVERLPLPKIDRERNRTNNGWRYFIVGTGKSLVFVQDWEMQMGREREQVEGGFDGWRRDRAREIFGGEPPTRTNIEDAEAALRRAQGPVKPPRR